jgi:hypothetical protein
VREHFDLVAAAVHYRRIREARLGELAQAVIAAAERRDGVVIWLDRAAQP